MNNTVQGLVRRRPLKTSPTKVLASFDKLIFYTHKRVKLSEVAVCTQVRHGAGSNIHINGNKNKKVWFNRIKRDDITLASLNPSDWFSWNSCFQELSSIFEGDEIGGNISTLDCALTLPVDLNKEADGVDFGRKQSIKFYKYSSKDRGLYVAKKGRKHPIRLYDKKLQLNRTKQKIDYDCTRLEFNFLPQVGLPICQLDKIGPFDPFKNIKRNHLTLIPPSHLSPKARDRFIEFSTLIDQFGFWWARRCLNRKYQNNFNKLFGDFYSLESIHPDYSELFYEGIRDYIGW